MPPLRVLTILEQYLPGTKGGGPIRSIEDLVDHLGDEIHFDIVAADRDLGDAAPYRGILPGEWYARGKARVRYLRPSERTLRGWRVVLGALDADLVYLNSLFARSSIKILLLRRLGLVPRRPYVVAPRGELHPGALSINPRRKRAWLFLSRWLGSFGGIQWQAADDGEEADIRRAAGASALVRLARQLPLHSEEAAETSPALEKHPGHARLVFLSRISRKKNLDYALRVLQQARGSVEFDIYGPLEDKHYWAECEALIRAMPASVTVRYRGSVEPRQVGTTFTRYHLFLFPTLGESFGRVIVEALLAGCPVLLSDQTPWHGVEASGGGWEEPLDRPDLFTAQVDRLVAMPAAEYLRLSAAARAFGRECAGADQAAEANRRLFEDAAAAGRGERGR